MDTIKSIGTAKITDFDSLATWLNGLTWEDGDNFAAEVKAKIEELFPDQRNTVRKDAPARMIQKTAEELYTTSTWTLMGPQEAARQRARDWERKKPETLAAMQQYRLFHEEYGQPLNVGCWNDVFAFCYFGNPDRAIVVPMPDKYLAFTRTPDRSDMSLPQLRAQLGIGDEATDANLLPTMAGGEAITPRNLAGQAEAKKAELANLQMEMERVKNGETKELAKIKAELAKIEAELERKKRAAMIVLEDKKSELEEKMAQLNAQIFMLDAQIYSICCFAGEVVKFTQIRKGANAPDTEPVVVHQKLRFLDEDLGRMTSIYRLDWDKATMFEEFLRYSQEAFETFVPNKRCISLVRLSKTGTTIGISGKFPYENLLENYEYYHGRTVGILIRNGENLWFGWTDEERVHIDDDLVLSRAATVITPGEAPRKCDDELDEKRRQRQERKKELSEKMNLMDALVSRAFIFSVLQGVVENTNWLPLPPGERLSKQSHLVYYSVADMCLEDHRFANFDQLIKLANQDVAEGDALLTMQYLFPGSEKVWQNRRGRGEKNRTWNVRAKDCTIYEANLVEYDKPVPMITYKYGSIIKGEYHTCQTLASNEKNLSENSVIIKRWDKVDRHIYVSLVKDSYTGSDARANFELYPEEFINLTWMNSVWLTWAINTKNLGAWHIKGTEIIYAHAIRYLNTALDHVRKREEDEKKNIDAVDPTVCQNPDWPLMLSDWKFMLSRDKEKRTVRTITPFQAKRFVNWVKDGMPGRKDFSRLPTEENNTEFEIFI